MNKNNVFRFRNLVFFVFPVFFISAGCSDDTSDAFTIGRSFIDPQTNIVLVDTFSLGTSTFVLDSFSTTSPDQFLVGEYVDEYLGKTSASAYFQIGIPDSTGINENSIFDSLTIRIKYADSYYGDTLTPFTLNVFRVNETMEEPDEYYFYNNTEFSYDEVPLGSLVFKPRPTRDSIVEIRLDDEWGKELMELLIDESDELTSNDKFIEYLDGLLLKCGDNTGAVLSFGSSDEMIELKLYTYYTKGERRDVNYEFPLYTDGVYFNHIEADRTGTDIEKLKTRKEEILSSETGNKMFLQAGTGVFARIDFPSIYKITEIEERYIYYRAELIFTPVNKSNEQVPFPTDLVLFTTNKYNEAISLVLDSDDETVVSNYSFDEQYNDNNYYSFDITSFLSEALSDIYVDEENGLIIGFQQDKYKSSLDRVVFDARLNGSYRPTLKLYFIFYE